MESKRLLAALVSLALLGGCSLAPAGGRVESLAVSVVDTAIADRQSFNDKKAETLLVLPCDISLGAYYRLTNSIQQEALVMLCSGRRVAQPVPPLNVNTMDPST